MMGVGSVTRHAVFLIAELADSRDVSALELRDSPLGTDDDIDSDSMAMDRLPRWRELLKSLRETYIRRAYDALYTAAESDDQAVGLVAHYDDSRRFLIEHGFERAGEDAPGPSERQAVSTLHAVVTWVFASNPHRVAVDVLREARERAQVRVTGVAGVLGLMIDCNGTLISLRQYLVSLLVRLWQEGSDFSSKKPFGDSDWQHVVYREMIRHGYVTGKLDEHDGGVEEVDHHAADLLIEDAIRGFGSSSPTSERVGR